MLIQQQSSNDCTESVFEEKFHIVLKQLKRNEARREDGLNLDLLKNAGKLFSRKDFYNS
jgi:hypothetical protein